MRLPLRGPHRFVSEGGAREHQDRMRIQAESPPFPTSRTCTGSAAANLGLQDAANEEYLVADAEHQVALAGKQVTDAPSRTSWQDDLSGNASHAPYQSPRGDKQQDRREDGIIGPVQYVDRVSETHSRARSRAPCWIAPERTTLS